MARLRLSDTIVLVEGNVEITDKGDILAALRACTTTTKSQPPNTVNPPDDNAALSLLAL